MGMDEVVSAGQKQCAFGIGSLQERIKVSSVLMMWSCELQLLDLHCSLDLPQQLCHETCHALLTCDHVMQCNLLLNDDSSPYQRRNSSSIIPHLPCAATQCTLTGQEDPAEHLALSTAYQSCVLNYSVCLQPYL